MAKPSEFAETQKLMLKEYSELYWEKKKKEEVLAQLKQQEELKQKADYERLKQDAKQEHILWKSIAIS